MPSAHVLASAIVATLTACSSGGPARNAGACDASGYPCGPYGYNVGSVIADLTLTGKRDTNGDGSAIDDPVTSIHLSDYRADPKKKVLAIIVGAETCVPCQNEQGALVALYNGYAGGGHVAFLEAIVQGQAGMAADQPLVDAWAMRYMLPFDLSADPTRALSPYLSTDTFPSAMAVRLSDMNIVFAVSGVADGLKAAIDAIPDP